MELTDFANKAINAIHMATQVAVCAIWDLRMVDAEFAGGDNPNENYNALAIQFVGSSCLTKVVDAYQWYNGRIFQELARHDSSAFERFREGVNLSPAEVRRIAGGEDFIAVMAEKISFRDASVRRHLHATLGLWEESEMQILVAIRNCFGHHLGIDVRNEAGDWLLSGQSPWGLKSHISVDNGEIRLGGNIPLVLSRIGLAQISIFDQTMVSRYGLPTFKYNPVTVGRTRFAK